MAKNTRRNNRKNHKNTRRSNRKNTRRNNAMLRRMMYGGYDSAPGSVNVNAMAEMMKQSLAQGQQFAGFHANQHGGYLNAGPFPGAVIAPSVLPEALHASARVAPLDAAITEIQGLRDQDGGKRKNRKSKKSRKGRKDGRKSRRNNMWSRKNRRGGSYDLANAQSVNASGMLLSPAMEAKALGGMNAEWKLAENPMAFAPGYAEKA